MTFRASFLLVCGVGLASAAGKPDAKQLAFFESKIRPVLVKHCYECHAADAKKLGGKLRLDTRDETLRGGESGAALVPGKPEQSLIIQALRWHDDLEMPPDEPLSEAIIRDFVTWIKTGAADPRTDAGSKAKPQPDPVTVEHWSWKARTTPAVPEQGEGDPLDAFVEARRSSAGLEAVRAAPPRVLLRRLYIDLLGLPPTMEQTEAFVADHERSGPLAVARKVDQLLASPHFGERWGRHWLDVARYGESNGDDGLGRNPTFPQAWRFRDYVIDAFNRDLPYDRFLREQIAGDLLPAKTAEERNRYLTATGFLAIGSKPAKAMNNNFLFDIIDDQINVVGTAVMGLSVACARCHDHKHDPIPTKDYYALAGIFNSTETLYGKGGNEKLTAPVTPLHALVSTLNPQQPPVPKRRELVLPAAYQQAVDAQKPARYAELAAAPDGLNVSKGVSFAEKGYAKMKDGHVRGRLSEGAGDYTVAFWFKNDVANNLRPITAYLFSRAKMDAKPESGDHLGIGGKHEAARTGKLFLFNGSKESTKVVLGGSTVIPPNTWNHVVLIRKGKRVTAYLNGQSKPEFDGEVPVTHGKVRDFTFGARSDKFAPLEGNLAGFALFERALGPGAARALYGSTGFQRGPDPVKVTGQGFAMGVRERAKPADTQVRINGEVGKKGPMVKRGFLTALPDFGLRPNPKESGRRELVDWLTHPEHPLTSRVMVNRIWLHLFGQALVDTPDDFGIYGSAPSHPELLDFLANRFIEDDWSVKQTIRRMVLSRTYQLDSLAPRETIAADPDNLFYARHLRRRMDAETLRDSLLFASGTLDPSPGEGSAIQDVVALINWPPGESTNLHKPSDHRSIYLCMLRHAPPDELAAFNLPTGVEVVGQRDQTTLPGHSLFLLNSPFVLERAAALARALPTSEEGIDREASLEQIYRACLQRSPRAEERTRALAYLAETGLPDVEAWTGLVQALFASNEFRYVD